MSTRQFGARIERNIDAKLLRGEGAFVDDIPLAQPLHAAFVRSPFARARVRSINIAAAERHPASPWFILATISASSTSRCRCSFRIRRWSIRTRNARWRAATFTTSGQTVAMVVAVNRYVAEDAAALVEVDYDPLDVEIDLEKAVLPGAPLVHDDAPNNIAAHFVQISGKPDEAFANAEHITKIRVQVDRSTAAPMECRAVAAVWDQVSEELTVWDGTQAPISLRGGLASILKLDEDKVRVIAPNVGGGFGQKIMMFHPDELLVPMAAMKLGRPVKYIEDRRENFIGASHERTQIHYIELAAKKTGEVIGLRDSFLHDTGAFIPYGIAVAQVASTSIAGAYRIPNIWVEFKALYTPTVQVTPYRGCGRPQACFAIERAMDQLAEELGLDRFEIRRRNLIREDEFPYPREGLLFADGLKVTLDSGQYHKAFDMILNALDAANLSAAQRKAQAEGRYLGLGLRDFMSKGPDSAPTRAGMSASTPSPARCT